MARVLACCYTAAFEVVAEKGCSEAALELSIADDESFDHFFGIDRAIDAGISP
jgi:hypothetical protein